MKKSPFRFGTKLLASATLLAVPALAVAWLSPSLLTASTEHAAGNWLSLDVPVAPIPSAQQGQQVDPAESMADDWGYTKFTKQQRRRIKAERRLLKLVFKAHIESLKIKLAAGVITQDEYRALRGTLKGLYITDRAALVAFQNATPATTAPADLVNPPNMSGF